MIPIALPKELRGPSIWPARLAAMARLTLVAKDRPWTGREENWLAGWTLWTPATGLAAFAALGEDVKSTAQVRLFWAWRLQPVPECCGDLWRSRASGAHIVDSTNPEQVKARATKWTWRRRWLGQHPLDWTECSEAVFFEEMKTPWAEKRKPFLAHRPRLEDGAVAKQRLSHISTATRPSGSFFALRILAWWRPPWLAGTAKLLEEAAKPCVAKLSRRRTAVELG